MTRRPVGLRRWLRPVRSKVLVAVLSTTALGLLLTGGVSAVVQRDGVDDRVDASLQQEVAELRNLAAAGDTATGTSWGSVDALLFQRISGDAADEHETAYATVPGGNTYVPVAPAPFDLRRDPGVRRLVAAMRADSPVTTQDLTTSAGLTRVTAVPVTVSGGDPALPTFGVYVVGHALEPEYAEVTDNARTFAVVAFGSLLLVAAVGFLVIARLLRPLDDLHDTATGIGADALSHRVPVHGDDDVADLARSFNDMLERLQSSFETQREFLDDAGHELRTPLTIVQGHLELLDVADPRDVLDTRALVLDELARMTRLVDDLTVLAKARRPDFVALRPVDVGRLLDETFDKVVPLGDRRWRVDARADVEVDADPQRLAQALVQLVSNAVKFTRTGDLVALGSAVRDDVLLVWVRDSGPGIAPEDTVRIFERFGRAATGRGVEGSGLGLSIVAAIAEAHGGRVGVSSLPGAGATFTLELPLTTATHPADPAGADHETQPLPSRARVDQEHPA